jgi:hypothetical protein
MGARSFLTVQRMLAEEKKTAIECSWLPMNMMERVILVLVVLAEFPQNDDRVPRLPLAAYL